MFIQQFADKIYQPKNNIKRLITINIFFHYVYGAFYNMKQIRN